MDPLEETTFSNVGGEGNVLTLADINRLAESVWQQSKRPMPNRIVQNGCEKWFRTNLAAVLYDKVVAFCGIPVHSSAGVPKGEFWVLGRNNDIIQKFKIKL